MVIRRNPETGRQAVLWLATAFVVLIGAAGCTFIILSAVDDPESHLVIMAGFFVVIIFLLTSLSRSNDKNSGSTWMRLWMAMTGKSDPKVVLRVGRRHRFKRSEYGTNRPPSIESVREAAAQNGRWVPTGPPPDRTKHG